MVPKAFGMTINPDKSGHFSVCLMMILIVSISWEKEDRIREFLKGKGLLLHVSTAFFASP